MTLGTLTIAPADVATMQREARRLFREHYKALCLDQERNKLDPDWDRYRALESVDALLILGAWVDGELVGYSANFVTPNTHYRHTLMCQNDVLWVTKKHRGGVGRALIRETERQAKTRGCDVMCWHCKATAEGEALRLILERANYGVQDIIYSRGL